MDNVTGESLSFGPSQVNYQKRVFTERFTIASIAQRLVYESSKLGMSVRFRLLAQNVLLVRRFDNYKYHVNLRLVHHIRP